MTKRNSGIQRAIAAAGGARHLASRMSSSPHRVADSITKQAVYGWLYQGYVPLERAAEINEITGVPIADLVNPRIIEVLSIDA